MIAATQQEQTEVDQCDGDQSGTSQFDTDAGGDGSLSDAAWRRQLAELALACAGAFPGEEPARIREVRALLADAPQSELIAGLTVPDHARTEVLLAAGAEETAVLALFGGEAGYLLSRAACGQYLASVILPGSSAEVTAGGDNLVLALIGALALALVEVTTGSAAAVPRPGRDGLRLN
jgi:hypothetical protein